MERLCLLRDPWRRVIKGQRRLFEVIPCGGGVGYVHRSPASRRRQRKGKSRIWDSKSWSRVPRDSDPRVTALARASSNCKRQTRSLVRERERAPYQQTRNCLTVIKIWSLTPDGCFIRRQTGRLTVGRNIRLRLKTVWGSFCRQLGRGQEIAVQGEWEEMARKELGGEKKPSCVIWSDSETVINPLPGYD
jgi:hypothetical protein